MHAKKKVKAWHFSALCSKFLQKTAKQTKKTTSPEAPNPSESPDSHVEEHIYAKKSSQSQNQPKTKAYIKRDNVQHVQYQHVSNTNTLVPGGLSDKTNKPVETSMQE